MTHGDKRRRFTHMQALLVLHALLLGYEIAADMAKRCRECLVGDEDSLHKLGLAIDFNLYIDNRYIEDSEGHDKLHDYWDSIGGAERILRDMNHYSYNPGGSKR